MTQPTGPLPRQAGSNLPQYCYTPLVGTDSFRLLQLLPANPSATLHGLLIEFNLGQNPSYEAVSYVWGEPILSENITIDGCTLPVTKSLHQTLLRLQSPSRIRTLWIDGICINQASNDERSHQVKLMRKIYSNCIQCVAYLGPEAQDSETVPALMQEIEASTPVDVISAMSSHESGYVLTEEEAHEELAKRNAGTFAALAEFLTRPWFRRLWIMQEAVLPQKVLLVCGNWEMDINTFHRFVELINVRWPWSLFLTKRDSKVMRQSLEQILEHSRYRIARGGRLGFDESEWRSARPTSPIRYLHLINQTGAEVTDPRDRFFAVLGLADDIKDGVDVEVDYQKSYEAVASQVASVLIKHGWGLGILIAAPAVPARQQVRPSILSWLADWQKSGSQTYARLDSAPSSYLTLDSDRASTAVRQISDNRIEVRGFLIDGIAMRTTANHEFATKSREFYREACDMITRTIQAAARPSDPEAIQLLVTRVMVLDKGSSKKQSPMPADELIACHKSLEGDIGYFLDPEGPRNSISGAMRTAYVNSVTAWGRSRGTAFGILEQAHPGIFPPCSQAGDIIFVVDGSWRTFLVRRHQPEEVYTWLGEVFVWAFDDRLREVISAAGEPIWIAVV